MLGAWSERHGEARLQHGNDEEQSEGAMSDTVKDLMLSKEELDIPIHGLLSQLATYGRCLVMAESIAQATLLKAADWIEKQTQDVSTDVPTRVNIATALREAAEA